MKIKSMLIEGPAGTVEITATTAGAMATRDHEIIAEYDRHAPRETRFEQATRAAEAIYGRGKGGRLNATNSMVHDVWAEMDRIAGA